MKSSALLDVPCRAVLVCSSGEQSADRHRETTKPATNDAYRHAKTGTDLGLFAEFLGRIAEKTGVDPFRKTSPTGPRLADSGCDRSFATLESEENVDNVPHFPHSVERSQNCPEP
jgi:hypothetical protein